MITKQKAIIVTAASQCRLCDNHFNRKTRLRREDLKSAVSYQASHDPLTGLANRRELTSRLERALKATRVPPRAQMYAPMIDEGMASIEECARFIAARQ